MLFQKINYASLKAPQKENYNFQKIASLLADYGFSCMWLNDDWQGADFIANHIDGQTFLKVQLKGRLTLGKKYIGKDIYVAYRHDNNFYFYPHDELLTIVRPSIEKTSSWIKGEYSWVSPLSKRMQKIMDDYKL